MRPAARRATKTAHGRPPLSFAPARRRLAPLWPVEAPIPAPCGRCRKRSSWPGSTPILAGRDPNVVHRHQLFHEWRGARCGGDENAWPIAEPQAQHHGIE